MRVYRFEPFELDIEQLLLSIDGAPVALGPKVVETLLALLEHPGEVVSKSALLTRIWPEGFVEEANLAQNIYVLRKTLRERAGLDAIQTVPRRGYRFTADVTLVERAAEAPAVASSPASAPPMRRIWPFRRPLALAAAAAFAVAVVFFGAAFGAAHRAATVGLSPDGARLYQLGRYYWNLRSREGVERSLGYFAQVVRTDPRDARGYAALAEANAMMGDYRYGKLRPTAYFARARSLAQRALGIDPRSAEAHAALGLIDLDSRHLSTSIAELKRAIALDPKYGPAHEWYGVALISRGDLPHAFAQLRTAADLDPLSVATSAWLGSAAYLDHHFNEAISYSQETLDLAPGRVDVWTTIGEAYEAEGNYSRAIDAFNRFASSCAQCRPEAAALLAHTEALQHRIARARVDLAYARAHANEVDPTDLAAATAAVGDRSGALALLRRLHGAFEWIAVRNDPRFDALRADAAFRQLAQSQA
jgi:DNA-binding winged helix-turn-helix (wHTH) protein/Tfp pilus assembly protein PilF